MPPGIGLMKNLNITVAPLSLHLLRRDSNCIQVNEHKYQDHCKIHFYSMLFTF